MVTDMPLAGGNPDSSPVLWFSVLGRLTHKGYRALAGRCTTVTHGRSRPREKGPKRETKSEFVNFPLCNAVAQIVGSASQRLLKADYKFTDPLHHKCTGRPQS
jgi:hypothetical protein